MDVAMQLKTVSDQDPILIEGESFDKSSTQLIGLKQAEHTIQPRHQQELSKSLEEFNKERMLQIRSAIEQREISTVDQLRQNNYYMNLKVT